MNAQIDTKYNGYTNYETWNICLWIENDEQLWKIAQGCWTYKDFKEAVAINPPYHGEYGVQTPDEILWSDPAINVYEVNECCFANAFESL